MGDGEEESALDLDPEVVRELAGRAKEHLRTRGRSLRRSLSTAAVTERSAAIARRLLALPAVERAKAVALYHPMARKNEADVLAVDPALRARGAVVAYPSIDRATGVMTFRDPGSLDGLADRGQGFFEPDPTAPEVLELDVIVVPALWIDPEGRRIGYGGGFYDRTLPRYRPRAQAVAAIFHFQLGADLPELPGDERVDAIVTDETTLTVTRPPG